jgi:hypothetical protein
VAERSAHRDDAAVGLSPDELEQRQRADGTWEEPSVVDDDSDEPLTPDMIEQRQVVEDDSDDAPRE